MSPNEEMQQEALPQVDVEMTTTQVSRNGNEYMLEVDLTNRVNNPDVPAVVHSGYVDVRHENLEEEMEEGQPEVDGEETAETSLLRRQLERLQSQPPLGVAGIGHTGTHGITGTTGPQELVARARMGSPDGIGGFSPPSDPTDLTDREWYAREAVETTPAPDDWPPRNTYVRADDSEDSYAEPAMPMHGLRISSMFPMPDGGIAYTIHGGGREVHHADGMIEIQDINLRRVAITSRFVSHGRTRPSEYIAMMFDDEKLQVLHPSGDYELHLTDGTVEIYSRDNILAGTIYPDGRTVNPSGNTLIAGIDPNGDALERVQ